MIDNEICYTGSIHDETTGLHYMNARYYDPTNGRFISQDSYRREINDPEQWHLYVYCANNPINYTDPSGHRFKTRKKKSLPYAGERTWLCLKTTKKNLREKIAPYYKQKSASNLFIEWIVEEACGNFQGRVGDAVENLVKNVSKAEKMKNVIELKGGYFGLVGIIETIYGARKALWKYQLNSIWEKIDKFYKNNLKGTKAKENKTVYFCVNSIYRKQGQGGCYKPTATVELYLNKHSH